MRRGLSIAPSPASIHNLDLHRIDNLVPKPAAYLEHTCADKECKDMGPFKHPTPGNTMTA